LTNSIKYSTNVIRMSKKEKLVERLLRKPVDMRFEEVTLILEHFGFVLDKKNQKGSHFVFFKGEQQITIPAHNHMVKRTYLQKIIETLGLEE
jgi:predicted RNA binding protein YcfA (HicA-like mRNA interferase family)